VIGQYGTPQSKYQVLRYRADVVNIFSFLGSFNKAALVTANIRRTKVAKD
jgi:hypothetical protein